MGQLGRTQKSQAASEKKLKAYACELEQKLEARTRELAEAREDLAEALEQQTATSEVLRIISSSPGKLEPVFEAVLANAVRICQAKFGNLVLYDGNAFRMAAILKAPPAFADFLGQHRRGRFLPEAGNALDRVWKIKKGHPHHRRCRRARPEPVGQTRWCANAHCRAHAKGQRADRRHHHLSTGGTPVH
jgi:hypothetical protein